MRPARKKVERDVAAIIKDYESAVTRLNGTARAAGGRAYGGVLRGGKGKLVVRIADRLFRVAWADLGQQSNRISTKATTVVIPINQEYLERIRSSEVRQQIQENINDYRYGLRTDLHVKVDGQFVIAVECKAYTENAMLKRILVDFTLLKKQFPALDFVPFQLESQLGGDYSELGKVTLGSHATHTLLSYFDIALNIITLLRGERFVDQPIHKKEYYKPLMEDGLVMTLSVAKNLLSRHADG